MTLFCVSLVSVLRVYMEKLNPIATVVLPLGALRFIPQFPSQKIRVVYKGKCMKNLDKNGGM